MVSSFGKRFVENPTDEKLCSTVNYISRINNYEYDTFDRLIKETRTDDGIETLNIEYDYYKNSGNLRKDVYKRQPIYSLSPVKNCRLNYLQEIMSI